jgi:hypothetical protein
MAKQILHLFGSSISDGESSPYGGEGTDKSQVKFFICDTRDDLPDNPDDMDFALNKEHGVLLVGNNGHWVRINPISE